METNVRIFDRAASRLPRPWRTLADWMLTIALAICFVLAFEAEVAKPYRIPSSSMELTLHCAKPDTGCVASTSDRVVANRLAYRFESPRRGEIVVFHPPDAARRAGCRGGTFVKRLIGLPGEIVSEHDGTVFIDGRRFTEPYVDPSLRDARTQTWPRVGDDDYFLMGDNRASSCDSRVWGTVPRRNLIGPVALRYWPPDRLRVY